MTRHSPAIEAFDAMRALAYDTTRDLYCRNCGHWIGTQDWMHNTTTLTEHVCAQPYTFGEILPGGYLDPVYKREFCLFCGTQLAARGRCWRDDSGWQANWHSFHCGTGFLTAGFRSIREGEE